ncbi:MAG: M23 family metallopeptidase [Lawsonibacter sp.]|nr:M23 family metallopeptidase [Lawsonibacter sp.]
MYSQQAVGRRSQYSGGRGRQRGRSQEGVRLFQLVVCLALFLTVFFWNGVFPQRLVQVRDNILTLISTDLDFEQALSNLGKSLSGSDTVLSNIGAFCVEVFGADKGEEPAQPASVTPPAPQDILPGEAALLSQSPVAAVRAAHYIQLSRFGLELPQPQPEPAAEPEPEPEPAVPAAGTVVMVSDYSGQELPKNYTMDQLSLGDLETMTPVLGRLNSEYGYRDHPINGEYHFHTGVDISGHMGDPIAAFADGTVEYTGKDDSYGLYLQVDHGNGVKSFYAHCSKVEVVKGQAVSMGDTLARIGSTGSSTGPHLHLELKFNKMHLNPAYYVDFLDS